MAALPAQGAHTGASSIAETRCETSLPPRARISPRQERTSPGQARTLPDGRGPCPYKLGACLDGRRRSFNNKLRKTVSLLSRKGGREVGAEGREGERPRRRGNRPRSRGRGIGVELPDLAQRQEALPWRSAGTPCSARRSIISLTETPASSAALLREALV